VTVRARKPIESGCELRDGRAFPADAAALQAAAASGEALDSICPYPLSAAISPERAARLAGTTITLDLLESACRGGVGESDFLLVEGAGGFLSPLAPDGRVADLAARLKLPILLVVADRLGCLNHALLTIEAIAARGLKRVALVLNRLDPNVAVGMDNAADLAKWLDRPVISLPYAPDDPTARAALGPLVTAVIRGELTSA
jgi:dethiobiotin synthetase